MLQPCVSAPGNPMESPIGSTKTEHKSHSRQRMSFSTWQPTNQRTYLPTYLVSAQKVLGSHKVITNHFVNCIPFKMSASATPAVPIEQPYYELCTTAESSNLSAPHPMTN